MLWSVTHFLARIRIKPQALAVLVLAVTALTCVGGLASPAMAGSMGQNCFGPECGDQIGCGQPAQPQTSPRSSVHLVALPAAVELGLISEPTEAPTVGPSVAGLAWQPLAQHVPRAPPAV